MEPKRPTISEGTFNLILERILWLKQKAKEQRRVGGPEFTSSDLLRGRTQGEIGALQWLLREAVG